MPNSNFVSKSHLLKRKLFRITGSIILTVGLICMLIAFIDFFTLDPFEVPSKFYMFFIGVPIVFVGCVLLSLGFIGAVANYQSKEIAPVAKDALHYIIHDNKEAPSIPIKPFSSSVVQAKQCSNCHNLNQVNAAFCQQCGHSL